MNFSSKNVFNCLFFRPWLGVPLGIWVAVSVVYYWWLISRIDVLETENKVIRKQLTLNDMQHFIMHDNHYHVPQVRQLFKKINKLHTAPCRVGRWILVS